MSLVRIPFLSLSTCYAFLPFRVFSQATEQGNFGQLDVFPRIGGGTEKLLMVSFLQRKASG